MVYVHTPRLERLRFHAGGLETPDELLKKIESNYHRSFQMELFCSFQL